MPLPDYAQHDPKGWCGDPTRGAALGRHSYMDEPDSYAGALHVEPIWLEAGYDRCGTYFGIKDSGDQLFWIANDALTIDYVILAKDRDSAKVRARERWPAATVLPADRDQFVRGVATALWEYAWAQHVDRHKCQDMSGCRYRDYMPEPPELAWKHAQDLTATLERRNGVASWAVLFLAALNADGKADRFDRDGALAEKFGDDFAYMMMGVGSSWFEKHAEFPVDYRIDTSQVEESLCDYAESSCGREEVDQG